LRRRETIGQPRPVLGQKNQETRTGNPADRFVQFYPGRLSPSAGAADGAIPTRCIGGWLAEHGDPTFAIPPVRGEKGGGWVDPAAHRVFAIDRRQGQTRCDQRQQKVIDDIPERWAQLASGTANPRLRQGDAAVVRSVEKSAAVSLLILPLLCRCFSTVISLLIGSAKDRKSRYFQLHGASIPGASQNG
jgi:hypothetical protein